jgi:hypothetical protein
VDRDQEWERLGESLELAFSERHAKHWYTRDKKRTRQSQAKQFGDAMRSQCSTRSRRNGSRSRNHDCSQPPPRIRTSGATASGSCLR